MLIVLWFIFQVAIMMFGMYMYDTGCSAPPVDVAFSVLSVLNSMRVNILVLPSSVSFFAQVLYTIDTWWRHQMETFSALLAICAENSSVNSPHKGHWRGSLIFYFNLRLDKRLSFRCHRAIYDVTVMNWGAFKSHDNMVSKACERPNQFSRGKKFINAWCSNVYISRTTYFTLE